MSANLTPPPELDPGAALFLDLDGTLLDFADRPAAVHMHPGTIDALERLRLALGGALAVVSGRTLAQIDALCPLPGLAAAGLHGAQLRSADGRIDREEIPPRILDEARAFARARLMTLEGTFLEDKGAALALHYRGHPSAAASIAALASELQGMTGSAFVVQHGNHVVELRPQGRDKGSALAALMATAPFTGRTPWMIGDDHTDEHAFAAAIDAGGIGVLVGDRRPTLAPFGLGDPPAVRRWLERAATRLQGS